MLRRGSRGISTNQGFMSDHSTIPPPAPRCAGPSSRSPSIFFIRETDPDMIHTPILDHKPVVDPFFHDKHPRRKLCLDPKPNPFAAAVKARQSFWERRDHTKAIGLGIVDALENGIPDVASLKQNGSSRVLFGSQLRIQIPNSTISRTGSMESLKSPVEFGAKNKSSQLALFSPIGRSTIGSINFGVAETVSASSPRIVTGKLSESELELLNSEDYTCVIFHGPNPKTTHIFDCYMEDCNKGANCSLEEENGSLCDCPNGFLDDNMSFCKTSCNNLALESISSVTTRTTGAKDAKKFT